MKAKKTGKWVFFAVFALILALTLTAFFGVDNYYGDTISDKIDDFCDRYWNLMHGWKKYNTITNNEEYE